MWTGDGMLDMAVGAMLSSPAGKVNCGSLYAVSSKICRALYRLDGQHNDDQFSYSSAAIGDVDGDRVS
jgi:hypothetical protein